MIELQHMRLAWEQARLCVTQSGVGANESLGGFLEETESLFQNPQDSMASPFGIAARTYQLRGICSGLQGQDDAESSSENAHPLQAEWRSFLGRVREGTITSRRNLSEPQNACSDAFLSSALLVFPDGEEMPAVRTIGRCWGRKMSPQEKPLSWPVPAAALSFSREMGLHAGTRMKEDYEIGLAGGLAKSVLQRFLHLRDVSALLGAMGWMMGAVHGLRAQIGPLVRETYEVLESNRGSIIYRTLMAGDLRYPWTVVNAVPSMLSSYHSAIDQTDDDEAKSLLDANLASVFNRALVAGDLDYPSTVANAFPSILSRLNAGISAILDPRVRALFEANRATIVNRALHHNDLDYPATVVAEGVTVVSTLIEGIEKVEPKLARAVYLALNRGDLSSLRPPR